MVNALPFFSQNNELGTTMVRIRLKGDETSLMEVIDNPLHILAIGPHVARQPGDGLGMFSTRNGSKNLPACAGQSETGHKAIARIEKEIVETENVEGEGGDHLAGRCSFDGILHFWGTFLN